MANSNRRKERARRSQQPALNRTALWVAVVFAGIGAALSFYATQLTYNIELQGIVEASGCSLNDFVNCDVANASSYAKLFGVPVAWFGFLFYVFSGLSALFGATASSTRQPASFVAMSLVLAVGAVLFTFVKAWHLYELGVLCLVCVGMYVANFGILGSLSAGLGYGPVGIVAFLKDYVARIRGDAGETGFEPQIVKIGVFVLAVFGIGFAWSLNHARDITGGVDVSAAVEGHFRGPVYDVQVDPEASIWGNPDAGIEIVEFADFQCPACQQSAFHLRPTLFEYEDDVKVVFMNYPLDSTINPNMTAQLHPQAGNASKASVCAEKFGDFWSYHDEVFKNQAVLQPTLFTRIATDLGWDERAFAECMVSEEVHDRVLGDMEKGRLAQVASTPTLYINGRKVAAWRNTDVIRAIVREEMARQ
ncbi:MAG: thioredoxin domain-containing protein [Bacteroidetes bacterium]|nr:thioredoxin domain-containing protein [Bacteroidota bacterium]